MSDALTIAQALKWGGVVLFCPACRELINVVNRSNTAYPVENLGRCPRCYKAFLDVLEPPVGWL